MQGGLVEEVIPQVRVHELLRQFGLQHRQVPRRRRQVYLRPPNEHTVTLAATAAAAAAILSGAPRGGSVDRSGFRERGGKIEEAVREDLRGGFGAMAWIGLQEPADEIDGREAIVVHLEEGVRKQINFR